LPGKDRGINFYEGQRAERIRILALEADSEGAGYLRQTLTETADRRPFGHVFNITFCDSESEIIRVVEASVAQGDFFGAVLIDLSPTTAPAVLAAGEHIRKIDPQVTLVLLAAASDFEFGDLIDRIPPENKVLVLQKPYHAQELIQFILAAGATRHTEKALERANSGLTELNTRLMENNKALSVLARNLDGNRQASERRILQRTRTLIIPIIEKLQRERNMEKYRVELELLLNYVENLTADLASDLKIASALSPTEMRIASLIKNGMSSEEIAGHENVSIFTVKTHRKNIRRKLKLKNSGINLRTYLESEDYKKNI